MELNEQNKIIEKAEFYRFKELKCHVLTIPKGTFHNGVFVSELKEETYFWFMRDDGIPFRLFLVEIFNIEEYRERGE